MFVAKTDILDLFAVWNEVIEDYEITGTFEECRKYCDEYNNNH